MMRRGGGEVIKHKVWWYSVLNFLFLLLQMDTGLYQWGITPDNRVRTGAQKWGLLGPTGALSCPSSGSSQEDLRQRSIPVPGGNLIDTPKSE